MIPQFPKFKLLEIEDRKEIESYLDSQPPYSDFIFSSLWSWDTKSQVELSNLNGNLVVKFPDYSGEETFFTFIGGKDVENTIETLMAHSKKLGLKETLKLLPENNFINTPLQSLESKFSISEDRDNFDYILSTEKLSTMKGSKLYNKRKQLNRFLNEHKGVAYLEDITSPDTQKKILDFVRFWEKNHTHPESINKNEWFAIERILKLAEHVDMYVMFLYVEKQIAGFSIFEILKNGYAVHAFQKADHKYSGVYEFLNHEVAKHLNDLNIKHLNIEQDLGLAGLRQAKTAYDPTFLKKYTVTRK